MKTLRLILGDQLNHQHSWFARVDPDMLYCMMEIMPEASYAPHHNQKILAFFAAMRHFSEEMQEKGHRFIYYKIDDTANQQQFEANIRQLISAHQIQAFEYQQPDEYRLDQQFLAISNALGIDCTMVESEHFLTQRHTLHDFFKGKKNYVMEPYYRHIRQKHGFLMVHNEPIGGRWNYDTENRKTLKQDAELPKPLLFHKNLSHIWKSIENADIDGIGEVDAEKFPWPVTRSEALELLNDFCQHLLPSFGKYQDAMLANQPFLYHSRLSFAMNVKLLHPKEVLDAAILAYHNAQGTIDIAQVEGFVRQIAGWREYMRGVYWAQMPQFSRMNYFDHQRMLPGFYWTGKTKMHCMAQSISQSLKHAYAHHIQRLMITGNFALLSGIDPDELDQWYLGIYIDAIEWVEITNTRGMSQYADGGLVGTKPYVSGANYINKMSDYCKNCYYDPKIRYGDKACPFNSLYWNFYHQHRQLLQKNPRIGMAYRLLDKMSASELSKIVQQADEYLKNIEDL
ncbi:MAG: cryptochrome/photolyase family protein [Cyclobacteriaceae bacterium]